MNSGIEHKKKMDGGIDPRITRSLDWIPSHPKKFFWMTTLKMVITKRKNMLVNLPFVTSSKFTHMHYHSRHGQSLVIYSQEIKAAPGIDASIGFHIQAEKKIV